MRKFYSVPLLFALLFLTSCEWLNGLFDSKEPTEEQVFTGLTPTLEMDFEVSSLTGQNDLAGFNHIVFTGNGRGAALSTRNEVFFTDNGGSSWQLIRKYPDNNKDTLIQSIAIHPTGHIIFLGAKFFHNNDFHPRYLILKNSAPKVWDPHIIFTPRYRQDNSNRPYLPSDFNYQYSYWHNDGILINAFLTPDKKNGMLSFLENADNITNPGTMQVLESVDGKRPFVATAMAAIDNKRFAVAGYEIWPVVPEVRQKYIYTLLDSYLSPLNNSDKDQLYLPDYMASNWITFNREHFSIVSINADHKKIFRTNAQAAVAIKQQEIIPSKKKPISGKYRSVAIDLQGHLWVGTDLGMYKSVKSLFEE